MGPDYSAASLSTSYRHLSDQIGNLLQRISSPKLLLAVGDFRQQDRDAELDGLMSGLRDTVDTKMATYEITAVCQTVMELVMAVSLGLNVVHRHDDPLPSYVKAKLINRPTNTLHTTGRGRHWTARHPSCTRTTLSDCAGFFCSPSSHKRQQRCSIGWAFQSTNGHGETQFGTAEGGSGRVRGRWCSG
jgi:hypothetical protein